MRSLLLLLCICISLAMPCAYAQMGGGGMGGPGGGGAGRGDDARKKTVSADSWLREQAQQQIAEIEEKIKFRPDQHAVWEAYLDKVSALTTDLSRNSAGAASAKENAPQQIERKLDVVRNRLTALEDIAEVARKLYVLLDPAQKTVADQLLASTVPALYSGFWQEQMGKANERGQRGGEKGGKGGPPANGGGTPPER